MAIETEHKFLIDPKKLPKNMGPGALIIQGYMARGTGQEGIPTIRVRIKTDLKTKKRSAFITVKGPGLVSREEFEYKIPAKDADSMMKLCPDGKIEKIRRVVGGFEIDEFLGFHKGLWTAEFEVGPKSKLPKKLPKWITRDVTGNVSYANTTLVFNELMSKAGDRMGNHRG